MHLPELHAQSTQSESCIVKQLDTLTFVLAFRSAIRSKTNAKVRT